MEWSHFPGYSTLSALLSAGSR